MRFAYIDSHGNEVPIPSVDALALRIELGAVGPDTQLYDAQADHWGPAKTHEIFHTLQREVGDEGFVAPPPPVGPPPAAEKPKPKAKPKKEVNAETPAEKEGKNRPKTTGADLGLTLAAPPADAPEPPEPRPAAARVPDMDLDLAPSSGFDFGGMGDSLELEQPPASNELDLESPVDFSAGGGGVGGGDDLLLEKPMSEFQPGSPPGWMEEPGGGDDVMDFSTVSAETPVEEEAMAPPKAVPAGHRKAPKARPSKPKFRRSQSLSGPIVMIVMLLAVGVGGYAGWPILKARLSRPETPPRPPVVMPALSAELLQRMHMLADAAIADVVRATDQATTSADAPPEPPREWLAGAYLGNASQFASIDAFWTGLGRFVDVLRAGDWQAYHDALAARVQAAGLSPEDTEVVLERADSGYVAAEEARFRTYDAMERLVVASLDLHDFLLENEANIEYRPANTSTVDPVLEAVPSSPGLGERMWDMVDEITESLDALGSLDRVTRARLTAAILAQLQEVGVQ